jgi:hypothetical protein
MRVQESRARSRMTKSMLTWEIPDDITFNHLIECVHARRYDQNSGMGLHIIGLSMMSVYPPR